VTADARRWDAVITGPTGHQTTAHRLTPEQVHVLDILHNCEVLTAEVSEHTPKEKNDDS